jgi:hypothetical protein
MIVVVWVKFGLKISIITIKTNKHKTCCNQITKYLHLLWLIVVCLIVFCFVFHRPFVRDDERRLLGFIVVFGGRTSLRWLRAVPQLQNKLLCLVSFPPTPNS